MRIATTALVLGLMTAGAAFAQAPAGAPAGAPPAGGPPAPPPPPTRERPADDVARDADRKPQEIMTFAGVRPGMTVAELGPGRGYYTRMLSQRVGPQGKVYAVITQAQAGGPAGNYLRALAGLLGNVEVVVAPDLASIKLPMPADVFWTTENYHDFHNGPTANIAGLNKAVFDNLKPGGIFYVEDHSAAQGAGLAAAQALHRMDEAVARQELQAAGFRIEASTDLLRNPADNRAGRNAELGSFKSDRFGLRLRRP